MQEARTTPALTDQRGPVMGPNNVSSRARDLYKWSNPPAISPRYISRFSSYTVFEFGGTSCGIFDGSKGKKVPLGSQFHPASFPPVTLRKHAFDQSPRNYHGRAPV